jgi:hypothetical protein
LSQLFDSINDLNIAMHSASEAARKVNAPAQVATEAKIA